LVAPERFRWQEKCHVSRGNFLATQMTTGSDALLVCRQSTFGGVEGNACRRTVDEAAVNPGGQISGIGDDVIQTRRAETSTVHIITVSYFENLSKRRPVGLYLPPVSWDDIGRRHSATAVQMIVEGCGLRESSPRPMVLVDSAHQAKTRRLDAVMREHDSGDGALREMPPVPRGSDGGLFLRG
jgi:hypothetical protein